MELVSALAAETGQNPGESELAAYSGSFFILLEGLGMVDCNFKCIYNSRGECRQSGSGCIRDCCPDWTNCDSC